jgi:hypothetical protein
MLAYEAGMQIAVSIAGELGDGTGRRIVIYDQPTFQTVQAYNGFRALVEIIENGYYSVAKNPLRRTPSDRAETLITGTEIINGAKTIAGILTGLRSATDLQSQKTDVKENAIIAQGRLRIKMQEIRRARTQGAAAGAADAYTAQRGILSQLSAQRL